MEPRWAKSAADTSQSNQASLEAIAACKGRRAAAGKERECIPRTRNTFNIVNDLASLQLLERTEGNQRRDHQDDGGYVEMEGEDQRQLEDWDETNVEIGRTIARKLVL